VCVSCVNHEARPRAPPIGPFVGKLDTRAVAISIRLSLSFAVFSALIDPALSSLSRQNRRSPATRRSPSGAANLCNYAILPRLSGNYPREPRGVYSKISARLPDARFIALALLRCPLYRGIPLTRLVSHYTFRTASFPGCINRALAYASGAPAR
jgi:hypothetical protein